jgi:hypothetical protein
MTVTTGVAYAASCPLCHTVADGVSSADIASGTAWRCVICDLRWDAARLDTVAAYARYVDERARLTAAGRT